MQPPQNQPPQYPYPQQQQYPQQGYPQQQYPQQQGYPQQGYPQHSMVSMNGAQPKAPTGSIAAGAIGFAAGVLVFLIAGLQGRRAGWEMLALPTMVAFLCGLIAAIGGITAMMRKQIGAGLLVLALGGGGALLALVGFALGS